MKLFALAATTAVDARSWQRVVTPAPGFVNEQGGYWADQPTHPQAPQWNQQRHQPYVQKPQCCEGYTWISPSGDYIWMRKSGELHSKPFYTATNSTGAPLVLFWGVENVGNAPPYAIPGNWYLSSSLNVKTTAITVSKQSHGLRYCPQDYQSKPYTGNMNFECGQGPPQQQQRPEQCCNNYKWTRPGKDEIWVKNNGKFNEGKPVYEGVDEFGVTTTFYWKQSGQSSGEWWYGEDGVNGSLGTPTAPLSSGMNSCLEFNGSQNLQCGNPPPPATCDQVTDTDMLTSTLNASFAPVYSDCKIQRVMRELVTKPFHDDFIIKIENDNREGKIGPFNPVHINDMKQFHLAFDAWQTLTTTVFKHDPITNRGTEENVCGFQGLAPVNEKLGEVKNCNHLCADISDMKENGTTGQTVKAILEEFLFFVESEFQFST